MKKKNKILMSIVILIGLIIGIGYYLLIPEKRMEKNTDIKSITIEELLNGTFIDYGTILKNPLRVKGKISIKEDEFKNIVYTFMREYDEEVFKNTHIDIKENKIILTIPYNILGVDTQIEVNINPNVKNHDIHLNLSNLKVGKIKISNEIFATQLEKYKNKLPAEINKNEIIIKGEKVLPLILDEINIKNNNIIISLEIKVTNILEFIKQNKIKIKQ